MVSLGKISLTHITSPSLYLIKTKIILLSMFPFLPFMLFLFASFLSLCLCYFCSICDIGNISQ